MADMTKIMCSSSWFMYLVKTFTMLLVCTPSALAAWVHVTCHGHPEFSSSVGTMSCSQLDLLEDGSGYFISVVSEAKANRELGRLSVISGGGSIRNVGFDGGESKAYLRRTFTIDGEWRGWLPVTVTIDLNYLFIGDGESQLHANLWTYGSNGLVSENHFRLLMYYDGFEHTYLVHSRNEGAINIPNEGAYGDHAAFTLSATQLVHHSSPTLDVRVDLLGWSSPTLGRLGSKISASVEADARIDISIPEKINVDR
ncbi:MAG: hypothetical protein OER96_02835 [Gammaproteobacteria bacterium]|nr:hypothetical protein [Gammaproteobacteria bacterium]